LEKIETGLAGVIELRPQVFRDPRGLFWETYHRDRFAEIGINEIFVQDNHSLSAKDTLRGFHYQLNQPQAKVCWVVDGEALDVALDIRVGSPQFGKWTSVRLSATAKNQIYIPAGFAHAFLALTDSVQFVYKCSELYNPESEYGILSSDPSFGIEWGVNTPILSARDSKFPVLDSIPPNLLPPYTPR
jgi:dTDP-4-dehydrorhamnose 3,5-epimerase